MTERWVQICPDCDSEYTESTPCKCPGKPWYPKEIDDAIEEIKRRYGQYPPKKVVTSIQNATHN